MKSKPLSSKNWKNCVQMMPIFGIDIIILNKNLRVLMGQRINDPAKGFLFVPGGRVYKGEKRKNAFKRILLSETGLTYEFDKTELLGIYEHFYTIPNSNNNQKIHYVIEARKIKLNINKEDINMNEQHSSFHWINMKDSADSKIHPYCKDYIIDMKQA